MPSASLWLGYYVTTRPKLSERGPHRVYFQVPAKLRPSESYRLKPIVVGGQTRLDLNDAVVVASIQQQAKALYESLNATRKGAEVAALPAAVTRKGSAPWLLLRWGGQTLLDAVTGKISPREAAMSPGDLRSPTNPLGCSAEWLNCEPRSRKLYIETLKPVFAWSITLGHRPLKTMQPTEVAEFLSGWDAVPGQRKNIRGALSRLFAVAIAAGELKKSDNPLLSVVAPKRKRIKGGRRVKVDRWARKEVGDYAEIARTVRAWRPHNAGRSEKALTTWAAGGRMVQLMYQTSADSTDVITWTQSEHLKTRRIELPDGSVVIAEGIEFDRGKTGVDAFIPLGRELVAEIRASGCDHLVTDPFGVPYRPVLDDSRLRGHLVTLREKATAAGLPHRVYDHLRHSAITEGVEAGIAPDDMMHLSAHSDADTNKEFYLQVSAAKAYEIQLARGLVK